MRNAQYYVTLGSLEAAKAEITKDAIDDILRELETMSEYDLVDILKDVNSDFHTMDELNDTFSYMSVTEVLEELENIDLYDEYFNESTLRSGNDIWEMSDADIYKLAEDIHDGYIECSDIEDILEDERLLIDEVTNKFKIYDKAKELFEQAMERDPQEVLNLLWNARM